MENPYSQAPLDLSGSAFRLVELQPCGPSDTIRCRLRSHPLTGCPSYIALSYMWDHDSPKDYIELNGVLFAVGHSLWTFLNRMRLHGIFTTFWIDALCIDQSSIAERNHQVQLMRQIYSCAQSVSIWLGEAEEGSEKDEAMDFIAEFENDRDMIFMRQSVDWAEMKISALRVFCQDPYWNCIWIVQEVVLAKMATIYCGSRVVDYPAFRDLIIRHPYGGNRTYRTPAGTLCLCAEYMKHSNLSRLHFAIWACMERRATKIHDKIYALLGVVEDEAECIPVDYASSLEDLWLVVFSYICRRYKGFDEEYLNRSGNMVADTLEIDISEETISRVIEAHYEGKRTLNLKRSWAWRERGGSERLMPAQSLVGTGIMSRLKNHTPFF